MRKIFVLLTALLVSTASVDAGSQVKNIGALGRITPAGGIISLVAPSVGTIAAVKVKEGEVVEKNAPVVVLHSSALAEFDLAQAELALREAQDGGSKAVALQQMQIDQLTESSAAAIALQRLKLAAAEADLAFATKRHERFGEIGGESLSAQQMEERQYRLDSARLNREMAFKELQRLELDRKLKLASAGKELERLQLNREVGIQRATQQLDAARHKLNLSVLRAPVRGTILKVLQHEGETAGTAAALQMADLEKMVVVAEVFQSDLLAIAPGMPATITSAALPRALNGIVRSVSRVISGQTKVADVTIDLEESHVAARLIFMEVEVSITPEKK